MKGVTRNQGRSGIANSELLSYQYRIFAKVELTNPWTLHRVDTAMRHAKYVSLHNF